MMSNLPKTILKILLPLAVMVLGGFSVLQMIEAREEPQRKEVEVSPPLVQVVEAKRTAVKLTVHTEGTVAPRRQSRLVPEVSGQVVWVSGSLAPGAYFKEREELLKIDPRDYELAMVNAKAAITKARLRLAMETQEAKLALREWEHLGEGEAAALTLREPQIEDAKAALASAEAALEQNKFNLERTILHAPYDGRVRDKSVDIGQFVTRGTPIASVYSVDYAEVRLPIPDDQVGFVDLPFSYRGEEKRRCCPRVEIRARFGSSEYTWSGWIVRTEAEIDPKSGMVHAIAEVAGPYDQDSQPGRPPLAMGMFVEAEIQGKTVSGVTVLPRSALQPHDQILVVDAEQRLRFQNVAVLRTEEDRVLVKSGVESGQRVCVSPLDVAVEGMQVRVVDPHDSSGPSS